MTKPLKDFEFELFYRTGEQDIVHSFFLPCLATSRLLYRGAGYFASSSLIEVVEGLEPFVMNNGKICLVASPFLNQEDAEAIGRGHKLLDDPIVADRVRSYVTAQLLTEILKLSTENRKALEVLSWMIANGTLELKLALRSPGFYHEKFGVFFQTSEPDSYRVGFLGSGNATAGGLVHNLENTAIFQDKDVRENKRNDELVRFFSNLWSNTTEGVEIMDFPEAAKKNLISYRPSQPPVPMHPVSKSTKSEAPTLRDYQEAGIRAWEQNGRKGILMMVTGGGKTFTALSAIKSILSTMKVVLIAVPSTDLLNQWGKEVEMVFPGSVTVKCGSENVGWPKELIRSLRYAKQNEPIFVVGTLHALRDVKFQHMLKLSGIKSESILLVIDEVHRSGSNENRQIFNIDAGGGRLGLSATPIRKGDEEGSEAILDYFDGIVHRFTIKDAIEHDPPVLTPYNYYIHPVHLESEELADYRAFSKRIARKFFSSSDSSSDEAKQNMTRLLIERKNIIKAASGKLAKLKEIIEVHNPRRCLVYCNDSAHVDAVYEVIRSLGKKVGKYTSTHLKQDGQRETSIDWFKQDDIDFLVAVKCLDEGVDIPICESAIILSSSTNDREYIQRRGRVLRLYFEKKIAHIHDLVTLPCSLHEDIALSVADYNILKYELERAWAFAQDASNSTDALLHINKLKRSIADLVVD